MRHVTEGQPAELPGSLVAIHSRHLPVKENDVVGLALPLGTLNGVQSLLSRFGLIDREAQVMEHLAQHLAGAFVVVYHQHAFALQVGSKGQFARLAQALAEAGGEPEGAALAGFALHADFAIHKFGQLFGNGQAEAGAAKLAGGRGVGLGKSLEQPAHLLLGETAAGIAHSAVDQHIIVGLLPEADDDVNLAMVGEGDGIVGVVDKNLPESQGVADQARRHVLVDIKDQFQPFGGGLFGNEIGDIVEHLFQFELGVFDGQLAFLDL